MEVLAKKISVKEKIGYSLGDTASHFVWDMVGFWLLFFYTDVYGISAAAAGTIMLIARFWDMAIDPVIGVISDRTNTRLKHIFKIDNIFITTLTLLHHLN